MTRCPIRAIRIPTRIRGTWRPWRCSSAWSRRPCPAVGSWNWAVASGGNLIPLADELPESQFLGIDLSARPNRRRAGHDRRPRAEEHRAAQGRRLRDRRFLGAIRLHHLLRRVLLGAPSGARQDLRRLPAQPGVQRGRDHLVQHLSRLASPRGGPRPDALPRGPSSRTPGRRSRRPMPCWTSWCRRATRTSRTATC